MNEKQRLINRQIDIACSRLSLAHFVLQMRPDYLMGWVHEEICDRLDRFLADVRAGKSPRLIITMPPRSGKSEIVSRCFPAYCLGRDPDLQIIACSYSADLVSRFNRDVQRIIDSPEYAEVFPDTKLSGKRGSSYVRTSELFEVVDHGGSYRSAGVGGGITGQGADILIIDDAVKDRSDADSQTIRDKTWDWYTSTAYTRLSPGGGVIAMATRWHMDDLIGRLLERMNSGGGDHFEVVNYPAIAEQDEPHRKIGEALHPERYPVDRLNAIRKAIGERDWAAEYQQHPIPDGGAIFRAEWLKEYSPADLPPTFDMVVTSWDMTFKDSAGSDYVVGQVWGKKAANFYLLDQVRGRWDFVKTKAMFLQLAAKHPKALRKLVEDKANGTAVICELQKTVPGIVPVTPTESKTSRAQSVTPFFEAGNVFIPAETKAVPWVREYRAELLSFPSGAHDDQVDATTQALNFFRTHAAFNWTKATADLTKPIGFFRT